MKKLTSAEGLFNRVQIRQKGWQIEQQAAYNKR